MEGGGGRWRKESDYKGIIMIDVVVVVWGFCHVSTTASYFVIY